MADPRPSFYPGPSLHSHQPPPHSFSLALCLKTASCGLLPAFLPHPSIFLPAVSHHCSLPQTQPSSEGAVGALFSPAGEGARLYLIQQEGCTGVRKRHRRAIGLCPPGLGRPGRPRWEQDLALLCTLALPARPASPAAKAPPAASLPSRAPSPCPPPARLSPLLTLSLGVGRLQLSSSLLPRLVFLFSTVSVGTSPSSHPFSPAPLFLKPYPRKTWRPSRHLGVTDASARPAALVPPRCRGSLVPLTHARPTPWLRRREAAREDVPDSPVPPSLGPGRPELQLKGSSGFSAPAHAPGGARPRPVGGSPGVLQSQQEALPRADFLEEGAQLGTPTRTKPQTNSPPVPSLKLPSDLQTLSLELEAVCAPTSSSGAPLGPFSITKYPHRSYLHPRLQGCPLRSPPMRDRPVRAAGSTVSELLVGPEPPPVPIYWHVKQDKPKFGERRGSRGVTPVAPSLTLPSGPVSHWPLHSPIPPCPFS